jgi:CheY-like chemotaxis protein
VNGQEALARANELRPDVIVLDLAMPVMNGLMAAQEITKVLPAVPVVLHTPYSSPQVEVEAKKHGTEKWWRRRTLVLSFRRSKNWWTTESRGRRRLHKP